MIYVVEFFIFAFIGWVMDSIYCTIVEKKIIISGYFKGIPICPTYGFGGIILFNTFALMSDVKPIITIATATCLAIIVELISGWFSENILDEKLWDYSNEFLNLNGYISAWHSFLWFITVTVLYFSIGQKSNEFLNILDSKININPNLEVLLVFTILGIAFLATARNKSVRLAKFAQKSLAEARSLEAIFNIEKLRALEERKREELLSNANLVAFVEKIRKLNPKL